MSTAVGAVVGAGAAAGNGAESLHPPSAIITAARAGERTGCGKAGLMCSTVVISVDPAAHDPQRLRVVRDGSREFRGVGIR